MMFSLTDIISNIYDKYFKIDYFIDYKVNNIVDERERLIN
jgi:hypothetical protein